MEELRSSGADHLETLRVAARYRRMLDEVSRRAVATARQMGRSWEDVADAVGTSRQSAWQRYRDESPSGDLVPFVMRRFPHRRRRHLALRDAVTADYGLTLSERAARELSAQLASVRPQPRQVVTLQGRDAASGARISKNVSAQQLSTYLLLVPRTRSASRPDASSNQR
jgi:uncharacterized NAD(P)/FAD-binding protein YdhS